MSLKSRITEDMKNAMRAKDSARLSTIRLLLAAIKQREVDERIELTDADVLSVIDKMIKQRRDSITQFEAGRREDLAAVERAEVAVLTEYMPAQLSDAGDRRADRRGDRGHRRVRNRGDGQGDGDAEAEARGARGHGRGFRPDQGAARRIGASTGSAIRAAARPAGLAVGNSPFRVGAGRL